MSMTARNTGTVRPKGSALGEGMQPKKQEKSGVENGVGEGEGKGQGKKRRWEKVAETEEPRRTKRLRGVDPDRGEGHRTRSKSNAQTKGNNTREKVARPRPKPLYKLKA
ncbi:hypothetical protein DFH08DRAFT_800049 [Mycena albidolilacea]|uniref:Uncharacterized protein n=1 Tax=Mycena albidolilacea TaxID=1033008 RepID=A0AAD7F352_9AGAR|nr:hypothetical protein DFH08DRAFT_800049 [Mycena albidolilacea]